MANLGSHLLGYFGGEYSIHSTHDSKNGAVDSSILTVKMILYRIYKTSNLDHAKVEYI